MQSLIDIEKHSQFDNFELIAQQIVEGFITGLHRSPFHGFSVEFAEHRLYNTGESTKYIDWKLYAKTDKLFVKRFEEETNLRCQIVIDTSSSMLFPFDEKSIANKLSFSLYSAAALIHLLKKQGDAIGISFISDAIDFSTKAKSHNTHIKLLYKELHKAFSQAYSQISFNKTNALAQTIHQIAENVHKRSLVILFSDFFENSSYQDIFDALQHLKHNKHEVILFHVTDPSYEEQFEFENRPLEITDMETGEIIKIIPSNIRNSYASHMQKVISDLQLCCAQFNIEYVKADIRKGFEQILLQFLIKRNKLL